MPERRKDWDDLVLPDDATARLRELASRIANRRKVHGEWGLDRAVGSTGVRALFAGPHGTGKTIAAEVVARETGLSLRRVDLRTVVSKYVGETERNLEAVFGAAAMGTSLLFFDEADALFGRRSDVDDSADRYANVEVGHLLQRIEAFDGVVVVATNQRARIEPALVRRFHSVIDFPFPDAAARERIWRVHLDPSFSVGGVDCAELARRYPFDGACIRDAVVDAAFLAADEGSTVGMRHLERACARLQTRANGAASS